MFNDTLVRRTNFVATTASDDQSELVAAAQSGDRAAFAEIYRRHASSIQRIIGARVHDHHRAEDLTAEVFVRALNKLHTFEPRGIDFSSWLLRIGLNLIIDEIRSAKNKAEVAHDVLPEPLVDYFGEEYLAALNGHMLRQALDGMLPDHRRVLEMRFLEGRTSEETARAMGKTHGAIRILQHRAIGAMRRHFTSRASAA